RWRRSGPGRPDPGAAGRSQPFGGARCGPRRRGVGLPAGRLHRARSRVGPASLHTGRGYAVAARTRRVVGTTGGALSHRARFGVVRAGEKLPGLSGHWQPPDRCERSPAAPLPPGYARRIHESRPLCHVRGPGLHQIAGLRPPAERGSRHDQGKTRGAQQGGYAGGKIHLAGRAPAAGLFGRPPAIRAQRRALPAAA
nr:hypothetical protein [Tanacetum cinerariifolium]